MTSSMRILLSAYACEPGRGSEPGVGWNVAKFLSDKVSMTVVTRSNNRPDIEGCGEEWVNQVNWIYHDLPPWMMWWKKGGRGVQLYYILWQISLFLKLWIRREYNRHDIVHHITFGKYWIPSFLSLSGLPTVFGSVGGGEDTPKVFEREISKRGLWEERGRRWLRFLMTWNPVCLLALRLNAVNIAATSQTANRMKKCGLTNISVMPQSAISSQQLADFGRICEKYKKPQSDDQFVITCVARLISWKAIHLAIDAFDKARKELPEGSYLNIVGGGPEKERLSEMVKQRGMQGSVRFIERLPELEDVFQIMAESDCLLHPALHEAFGQACLEAIAVGTPVICWDWAGPGLIIEKQAGIVVPVEATIESSMASYAKAILKVHHMSEAESNALTANCRKRAADFTWDKLADQFVEIYHQLV